MSKTKLALLVFCIAFGVNIIGFAFSKKAFMIDENKNIWIYELPPSASPLDSYVAEELGPHDGIIGTIGRLEDHHEFKNSTLTVFLKPGMTYSNKEPILPEHWAASREYLMPAIQAWGEDPLWNAYLNADVQWKSPTEVSFHWKSLPRGFDPTVFIEKILRKPITGVIHPQNLAELKNGEKITQKWISSGPYRVRKWKPKEIVLASRDDFPIMLPKEFFRTLKYQSAPIRNPACDLIQALPGEEVGMKDHRVVPVSQMVRVFWVCRSWKEPGSFCASEENRANFANFYKAENMAQVKPSTAQPFLGKTIRYRIPLGSDSFRNAIREKIVKIAKHGSGTPEEISYLFKASTEADIELLMVVTDSNISAKIAEKKALLSGRLGVTPGETPPNLLGEISAQSIQILMKEMDGDPYLKTFLIPDLENKKIPL